MNKLTMLLTIILLTTLGSCLKEPKKSTYNGTVITTNFSPSVPAALNGLLGGGKGEEFFLYLDTRNKTYEVKVADGHQTEVRTYLIQSLSKCRKVTIKAKQQYKRLRVHSQDIEFICHKQKNK